MKKILILLSLMILVLPSTPAIMNDELVNELKAILMLYTEGTNESKLAFEELEKSLTELRKKWELSETELRELLNSVTAELKNSKKQTTDLMSSYENYKKATSLKIQVLEDQAYEMKKELKRMKVLRWVERICFTLVFIGIIAVSGFT